jgi:hypothetical protein
VKGAEFLGGNRMPNKRMPVVERRQETRGDVVDPSVDRDGITGRIPVLVAGLERALTWAGEPLNADAGQAFRTRGHVGHRDGERTEGRTGLGRYRLAGP